MGFDANVEFLRMAFWQILIISGPLLAVALAIGLAIGILQAATSIQEMTLTFVPKLILVVVAFGLLANFMMVQLSDYFSFNFRPGCAERIDNHGRRCTHKSSGYRGVARHKPTICHGITGRCVSGKFARRCLFDCVAFFRGNIGAASTPHHHGCVAWCGGGVKCYRAELAKFRCDDRISGCFDRIGNWHWRWIDFDNLVFFGAAGR